MKNLKSLVRFLSNLPVIRIFTQPLQKFLFKVHSTLTFWCWSTSDQKSFEFYKQFIKSGDLVFDVGANMGNRAKVFYSLGALVVGVEPQPQCSEFLKKVFGDKENFFLVEAALGKAKGNAEMLICEVDTISTLSLDWVNDVKRSGRFSEFDWDKKITVPVTTLDNLIKEYGIPSFIKIDVEGFEHEVLKGLNHRVAGISFEFVPEFFSSTFECLDKLESIGTAKYQISLGETMEFHLEDWTNVKDLKMELSKLKKDVFGDIYVNFNL